ncbi:MAG: BatD family protein, partial [Halioglobus sp.]|nr:BatD family protein [Halioglobus sp.]
MRGAVVLAMLIALLTGAAGRAVAAGSLAALRAQGQLQVATLVQPATAVVPGQKAELVIEIATNTWFTGGTRVTVPEVPGLVILQNEQFATNATQIRSGQTWVVQRWTLDVFAQRAGAFTVPPVRLQVKVNAGEKGDIEGELFTPATDIEVQLPDELARINQWTAAPAFEVSQQFDRALDKLAVGDALSRDIVLQASDLMAMMLPAPATGQIA